MLVQTDKGKLEGTTHGDVTAFKGIPFAAPPVAELRWRPPQPASSWVGVRKADRFGSACIQPVCPPLDGTEPVGPQSEDCLYLNVWTTGKHRISPKPVMVWIHGGAFKIGDGASTMYDGSPLARRGAIVVTFNYRLGHLGFFAHPALEKEFPNGPVNFGLLDQIAALEWVKRNISEFGGDPDNVTIFGESAGATSVLALFASPLANGLFHKGVAQSAYAIPDHSRAHAVELGSDVADRVFQLGKDPTIAQLRGVKPAVFALIHVPDPTGGPPELARLLAPVAVIGDDVLPRGIRDTFQAGEQKALPLILGSNSDEQSVLAAFGLDPAKILALITEQAGQPILDILKGLYRNDSELKIPEDLADPHRFGGLVLRDLLFTMQARWLATHHSKKAPTRRYYFSYVPELLRPRQRHGVPHGGEIVFLFNTGDIAHSTSAQFTEADRAMAHKVSDYWFSFAQTGTPMGVKVWPLHELKGLVIIDKTLALGSTIEVISDFRKTRLEICASQYPKLEAALGG